MLGVGQKEFKQIFPKPSWVEHNPEEIISTQIECIKDAVKAAHVKPADIASVGITNQRETTVVWNKETGKPIYNAIVWQCRRTADQADEIKKKTCGPGSQKNRVGSRCLFLGTEDSLDSRQCRWCKKLAEEGKLLLEQSTHG